MGACGSKSAKDVLDYLKGQECTLPFLAADVSADLFGVGYPNLWSVSGSAGDPLKFLRSLGAQYEDRPAQFAVVAQEVAQFLDIGHNLTDTILADADLATCSCTGHPGPGSGVIGTNRQPNDGCTVTSKH